MKKKFFLLLLTATILSSSCNVVNTLYPLSENKKDFLFKKELIGKWKEIKDSSVYYQVDTVAGENKKLYLATIVSADEENKSVMDTTYFNARFIQLGNSYFIDCQFEIEKNFLQRKDDYSQWLIARHFILRVSFDGNDKIEISYPASDELVKLINEKKIRLTYYTVGKDDYLILDKPAALRAALQESVKYSSILYKNKDVLVKLK